MTFGCPYLIFAQEKKVYRIGPTVKRGTVSFPDLRRGNIGIVVATQIGRYVAPDNPLPGWHSPEQAWAQTQGQLTWYKTMEAAGEMTMIKDISDLDKHLAYWKRW